MKKITLSLTTVFLTACLWSTNLLADDWSDWVANFRQEALTKGIPAELFDEQFNGLLPSPSHMQLISSQPENRLSFLNYRKSRIDNYRITLGRRAYDKNHSLLDSIGQRYDVDPSYVVAIWGLETSYGAFMGNYPVIRSLATLAYHSHRQDFFRSELLLALQILNEHQIEPDQFKGEWAGASGQCQFMPSSWYKYAVDFDGDGRKNIWTSKADALASIANYLKQNGWNPNEPWGLEVEAPSNIPASMLGLNVQKPLSYWTNHGVTIVQGETPKADVEASLIEPDGGPNFLVFNNFRVLMLYNNSIYYAASIGYLADKVSRRIS